jgi:DNA excision repair protein ERCC-4
MTDPSAKHTVLIVDTREQRPYTFAGALTRTLHTGDYSVEGLEDSVAIERKSVSDLLGCIGGGRERFERELERLGRMPYPTLIVEASLRDVLQGNVRCALHPNAVLGSLCAWSMRYRLPIWFCGDRRTAEIATERLLLKAAKYSRGSE